MSAPHNNILPPLEPLSPPKPHTYDPASQQSMDFTATFTSPLEPTANNSHSNPPSALATLLNLSHNISPTPIATTPPTGTIATHTQLGPLLVEAEKAFLHISEKLQVYYIGMVNAQGECKEKDVKIAQLEKRARVWEKEAGRLRAEVEMLKGKKEGWWS